MNRTFENELKEIYEHLGITEKHFKTNKLAMHPQPPLDELKIVDIDFEGKPFILIQAASIAWIKMRADAAREGVVLLPHSGFRSYLHQKN